MEAETEVQAQYGLEKLLECQSILAQLNFKLDIDAVLSRSRKREDVYARSLVVAYLDTKGLTLIDIGRHINRNHATAINCFRYIKRLEETDTEYRQLCTKLRFIGTKDKRDKKRAEIEWKIAYHKGEITKLAVELEEINKIP